ncbi:MAG: hypothetical protein V1659_04760 [Candidatus Woesearchaeota archaeon]
MESRTPIEDQRADLLIDNPDIFTGYARRTTQYFRQLELWLAERGETDGLTALASIPQLPESIRTLENTAPRLDSLRVHEKHEVYTNLTLAEDSMKLFQESYPEFRPAPNS